MALAAQAWRSVRVFLEMVKIEHSVFALPFAFLGMCGGVAQTTGRAWPGWWIFSWIFVAMVSCRAAAMAFNRIVDRTIDAQNPRTMGRAIPSGQLKLGVAAMFCGLFAVVFVASSAMLNPMAMALSPVALFVTFGYSYTKRLTFLCHLFLGASLGIAPAAACIGATGSILPFALWAAAGVCLWTFGFDVIYSLQDESIDREHGLNSIPARFGPKIALAVSRTAHALCLLSLGMSLYALHAGVLAYVGLAAVAALLVYEHYLVKPNDISRVNAAFFAVNGWVSILFFLFFLGDLFMRGMLK